MFIILFTPFSFYFSLCCEKGSKASIILTKNTKIYLVILWKRQVPLGVMMGDNYLNNPLYADNMIILCESEDELQLSLFKFYKTALNFNCKVFTSKTTAWNLCGQKLSWMVSLNISSALFI